MLVCVQPRSAQITSVSRPPAGLGTQPCLQPLPAPPLPPPWTSCPPGQCPNHTDLPNSSMGPIAHVRKHWSDTVPWAPACQPSGPQLLSMQSQRTSLASFFSSLRTSENGVRYWGQHHALISLHHSETSWHQHREDTLVMYTWGGHMIQQGSWTETEHWPGDKTRGSLFFLPFCPFLDLYNQRVLC